ncbi:hypothetical protein Gogos_013062 [Gossypium gossypioides]|uniref:RNase H type-1 domain-containing protein n=1 Tax=Gossypium gossypioides TaxID=34282 RepID=A0A7J9BUH1_GOSGO|nr:hypothetical protein [Gossypium gossypioides]
MHIKVRLEVRCPVKRRKKIALLKDSYVYAQNKGIHEHKWDTVNDIGMFVRAFMLELWSLQQSVPVNIERVVSRWKPPDAPFVKINFDAGFGGSEKLASTGVIRDNALAGVQAVQFAADLGFTYVILEGDARSVLSRLTVEGDDRSEMFAHIQDARLLMNSLHACKVRHIYGECNQPAHLLTIKGFARGDSVYCGSKKLPARCKQRRRWIACGLVARLHQFVTVEW